MSIVDIGLEGAAMLVVAGVAWCVMVMAGTLSGATTRRFFPAICLSILLITGIRMGAPVWLLMITALGFVVGVIRYVPRDDQ